MSSRASTPAGRKGADTRTRRRGSTSSAPGAKAKKPAAAKRTAKAATAKTKAGAKPTASRSKSKTTRAKPRTATTRRSTARRPSTGASRPKRAAPRNSRSAPTGRIANLVRPRNLVIAFVLFVAIAAGYRFWLRDSSLVAVTAVTVKGADGPESSRVESALTQSGVGMSTLDVNESALEKAVAPFATVSAIHVDSHFPHGLTVSVESRPPTLMVKAGSQTVPVAGDGTILNGVDPGAENLPSIRIASLPTGKTLSGDAFDEAVLTGAAPEPLHKLIDKVQVKSDQGVVITMSGLPVIFGTADRADEKWIAVAATLSDPKLDSLSYLDVRVPDRPAAGGAGESLADAPDPTTLGPADIVPPTAETTTTADPATEIAPDPTATVDPAVDPVVAPTETVVPPPTEEASASTPAAADAGGATATGGVVP